MMKAELLRTIGPTKLISYVKAKGWIKTESPSSAASIWAYKEPNGENHEVLLPLEQHYDDYAHRVGDLLTTVAQVERRSLDSILTDFANSTADIIRIKAYSQQVAKEKIPLEDGVRLTEQARDLVLAAANSVLAPKAYHQVRRSSQVDNYLKNAEMGQTEKGSFVFTLVITVPPALALPEPDDMDLDEPFERKVNKRLFQALDACRAASAEALHSSDIQPFEKAIPQGVSANLCEALAGLNESCGSNGLDLSMSWSLGRPAPLSIPSYIRFNNDAIPWIKEAARVFKETAPREDFELEGLVIRLSREGTSPVATILGITEERSIKVMVKLGDEDHQKAILAYRERIPVRCSGELYRKGNVYTLENPRKFTLQEDHV